LGEARRVRVFVNRVLRRIFGTKRDEVIGERIKLHNDELNDLYSSPSIFRIIKSRRIRWALHVARMGSGEVHTGFWWGNLRQRDDLEDPGLEGMLILSGSGMEGMNWLDLAQDRNMRGSCKISHEPSLSIRRGDFLD
jgi:hypothetical protein